MAFADSVEHFLSVHDDVKAMSRLQQLQQSMMSSLMPPDSIYASLDSGNKTTDEADLMQALSPNTRASILQQQQEVHDSPFLDQIEDREPENESDEVSRQEASIQQDSRGRTPTKLSPAASTALDEAQHEEDVDGPPASIMYDQDVSLSPPIRGRTLSPLRARFAEPELSRTSTARHQSPIPSTSVSVHSRSPSTSPPPDYIRSSPLSPQTTSRSIAGSRISVASRIDKGKARAYDLPQSSQIPLPARSPLPERTTAREAANAYQPDSRGLRLGGARAWNDQQQRPGRRNASEAPDLSRRERALWRWINVIDLDGFLTEVYIYYIGNGIWCIALERLLNLLTVGFVICFSVFLIGCIDYSTIRSQHTLADAIVGRCISRFHPTTLLFVLLFGAAYAWRVVQFGKLVGRLWEMHEFFEELLNVPEADVQTIPWHEIVNRVSALREEHPSAMAMQMNAAPNLKTPAIKPLDAHDVANRVMRETNYMIALFNREVLNLEVPLPNALAIMLPILKGGQLTKSLEWNLRFCLMKFLFGPDGKVRTAFVSSAKRRELIESLRKRFLLMGFINAALAPFIVFYLLIYSFFRYFEEYHKNPSSIGTRAFTELARWKFREYNELPHVFKQRLNLAHPLSQTYLDQFPKAKTAMLSRFVAFVAGSFASVLILFSILDPDAFLHFEVTPERSVLFYIGVFGTVLAIARGMVPEEHRVVDPTQLMQEIVEHTHYMPEDWKGRLHSTEVHAAYSRLFQTKITSFFIEVLSVITTPFVLWYSLPDCAPAAIDFFRESTVHVEGLGHVCSFGVFDFKRPGGVEALPITRRKPGDGKMEKSLINFKSHHPDWQPRDETTSLYLSNLQSQMPSAFQSSARRSNRMMLASTRLIAEETETELREEQARRAQQYERAYNKAAGPSSSVGPASRYSASTRFQSQQGDIVEESGLGDSYLDERLYPGEDAPQETKKSPETFTGLIEEAYKTSSNKRW